MEAYFKVIVQFCISFIVFYENANLVSIVSGSSIIVWYYYSGYVVFFMHLIVLWSYFQYTKNNSVFSL